MPGGADHRRRGVDAENRADGREVLGVCRGRGFFIGLKMNFLKKGGERQRTFFTSFSSNVSGEFQQNLRQDMRNLRRFPPEPEARYAEPGENYSEKEPTHPALKFRCGMSGFFITLS